ncbi:translation machinery-associated protein 16 [Thecaphora frezii]
MGGKKISERSIKRKSAPTHPNSRRATQLARVAHRKQKLHSQKTERNKHVTAKVDRITTLVFLLPDTSAYLADLPSVHDFINTFYLPRHDDEIRQLEAERRHGRPPAKREVELKDLRDRERREYMDGIEIPDFMSETNVRLLREWQGDPQALPNFTMIRVSGTYREQCTIVQAGNHKELVVQRSKGEAQGALKQGAPVQETPAADDDADAAMETEPALASADVAFEKVDDFANMK